MPEPTLQDIVLAAAVLTGQCAFLIWAARRGLWRHWRVFCAFLVISAIDGFASLLLLAVDAFSSRASNTIPVLYFYAFWDCALILAGLEIWMVWQIAGRITGCARRPWLQRVLLAATCAALGTAVLISLHAPAPQFPHPVMRIVTAIDRTLGLGWCLLFTALTASADLVGLKWRRQIIGITLGFMVQAVAGTIYSWLITASNTMALDVMTNCASLLSLCIWALALREAPYLILSPAGRATLETTLRQFEKG